MNSSNREKRPRESSESNKSFVKHMTSRMSGLLPSTITKWFSSPSSSNANGSATAVEASDSSTEDEAPESPTIGQPPSKRLRLSPSASNHFIGINTKSSSTNTDSTDYLQNTLLSSPSMLLKRESNFMSTPFLQKSEETTTKSSESENVVSYNLKKSYSSGDTGVTKTRKSLFNFFNNNRNAKRDDKSRSDSNRHSYTNSSLLGSPFYPGRTTYGGAASTSYIKNCNIHKTKNTVVNEAPANESLNVSHSARRIMDLFENYSSPLTEAKRISQYAKSENSVNTSVNTSSSNPDCKKVISYKTQELHVPSIASILSIKRRSRLMDTTSAARQLIASHSSSTSPYPVASKSDIQEKVAYKKFVTKMRKAEKIHKNKHESIVTIEPLNLPTAVLQIDKDNLPKFSFQSSKPKDTTNISVPLPSSNPKPESSNPLSVHNVLHLKPALASTEQSKSRSNNTFSFSEPVTVSSDTVTSHKLPVFTFPSPERSVDGNNRDCIQNVSSIVGNIQVKASTNVNDWKCNDCWVANKPHVDKCVCCGGKKPEANVNKICPTCKETTLTESLARCDKCQKVLDAKQELKGKSDSEKWKCQDCWVSNDSDKEKCVCCGGKKPVKLTDVPKVESTSLAIKSNDSKWKCEDCWVSNDVKDEKCVCCGGKRPTPKAQGKEAKQDSGDKGWKCGVCLLENGINAVKCVACLTAKPSSDLDSTAVKSNATSNFNTGSSLLQNIVKSQSQKWECPFCLVHNENTKSQCVCCDSERPGANSKQKETKFNFGMSPSTIFKFGIDPHVASEKEKNKEKKTELKETNNNVLPKASFTFGIPATTSDTATSKEVEKPKDAPAPSPIAAFSFGIPKEVQNKPVIKNDLTTTKLPILTSSEVEKIEKPQEVPNVDSSSSEAPKPKLQFNSGLFSTASSQPTLSLPTTTASTTLSFNNNTSSINPVQNFNNEAKSINVPATSTMSITNFFKAPASTAIESSSSAVKPPQETATLNSNISLFKKSEPGETGINFTAPPLFQKKEEQQPATSTPLFPKIEPQSTVNTGILSFQKNDVPATTATMFQKPETIVTTSVSLFSTGPSPISSTPSLFPKTDTTITSQSVSAPAPIFSFGTNSQTAPTQQPSAEKPKFNFSFGNGNNTGSNLFTSANNSTPAFGSIGDNNTNKFGATATPNATNMFSNNPTGNGLSSGNVLGGNSLGTAMGRSNLPAMNTGNTLQNNMQVPIAQGTAMFGATHKENSTWPISNNAMPNIFSTTASTNPVQKPAAFSFGSNNLSFNTNSNNSNIPVFGSNTQSTQNVFSLSNSSANNVASPFSNRVQNQTAPTMFGSPAAGNPTPSIGLFGQQNVAPAFGSTNTATFEAPQNSVPTPAFNFGSSQPSAVFGFGQQGQQQQASGVYSFGASASPQVQFAVGSAPSGAAGAPANVRRVKKVVRRSQR